MGRYVKLEENEDGTITATLDVGMGEQSFLMPLDFDQFLGLMIPSETTMDSVMRIQEHMIEIPNGLSEQP